MGCAPVSEWNMNVSVNISFTPYAKRLYCRSDLQVLMFNLELHKEFFSQIMI